MNRSIDESMKSSRVCIKTQTACALHRMRCKIDRVVKNEKEHEHSSCMRVQDCEKRL